MHYQFDLFGGIAVIQCHAGFKRCQKLGTARLSLKKPEFQNFTNSDFQSLSVRPSRVHFCLQNLVLKLSGPSTFECTTITRLDARGQLRQ
jgi:hypothetical protein